MRCNFIFVVALAVYIVPTFAFCQDTSVSFNGTIGGSSGVPLDSGGFNATPDALADLEGQNFSFNFSYSPSLPDLNTGATDIGNFAGLSDAQVLFGNNALDLIVASGGTNGQIEINNDGNGISSGSTADRYFVFLPADEVALTDPASAFSNFDSVSFRLILEDSSGNLFDNDSLINDASLLEDLDNFDLAVASLQFQNSTGTEGGTLLVDLQDTTGGVLSSSGRARVLNAFFPGSVAVPEPSTAWVIFAAVGMFASARRRQK